ncbi:MAG: formate dehydrogenase accessory sulfurtransferase FdhD [Methanoregula sp.]|nr:formate dehydrogenase accessory sulfurtransferase FdhD [Methanoregula sp.]
MLDHHRGIQVNGPETAEIEDAVAVEDRFELVLNNKPVTEMIASREMLRELGAGFVITEGLARTVDTVRLDGDRILVTSDLGCETGAGRRVTGSSGGTSFLREQGQGSPGIPPPGALPGIPSPDPLSPGLRSADLRASGIRITREEVISTTREIETEIWRRTGGVHCSVLVCEGRCLVKSSDLGRHNTVDKVVGYAALNGIELSRCALGCTGRQPSGMVRKCANAGIPIIISRAATTDKGIATAEAAGITLVSFSRGARFTVYTHPHRIAGLSGFRSAGS